MRALRSVGLALVLFLAACAAPGATPSAKPVELTVYGAASLSGVLADAKTAYQAANPGVTLTIATDSSATLRTQIEQGAPADVFLSADTKNPQTLADAGLTKGGLVAFAGNRLTIIVPTGNPAKIQTPADLARAGLRIVAAGYAVPITAYATQVVANLAKLAGYPAGFAASYAANVVSQEDNVKAIVAKIELGEGDAGIVYVTDAAASTKVSPVAIPEAANVLATYAGMVVRASSHATQAQTFLDWLAGPAGQAILTAHGFIPPP
ncbi:MAG: molybdate ABC transporter substrate-binding protein [Chloroflexota bacterium]|nr:molybdate ABC transporter substrate-binding protein [Chloroflexota bacterium]